jgi:hypothetical protein
VELEDGFGRLFREKWQRRLLWRGVSKHVINLNPGVKPIRLTQDYDLLIAVCQNWWDALYLSAIENWKDRCKASVCYIDEIWATSVPRSPLWLRVLEQFDHVILGLENSAPRLAAALGRPCPWVPGAVDALRFSPLPDPPARTVDVYSIGRKYQGVHQRLLDLSSRREIFYIYDTFQGADGLVPNHREHRDMFANVAKRSQYFLVGPAKMGVVAETQGQMELGYRYFEGAAAGTVMIGQAPDCQSFRELFGWTDSVIPVSVDGSDVEQVLKAFSAEPERLVEISRRNAAEALLRHDWSYRWKQILTIAGLQPAAAFDARERRLRAMSQLAREGTSQIRGRLLTSTGKNSRSA